MRIKNTITKDFGRNYPMPFEEKAKSSRDTSPNRKYEINLGCVNIIAVCPCCFTEILTSLEFKDVFYSSSLIGSRYEFSLKKFIPFNEEKEEYKKYENSRTENIRDVATFIDEEMEKIKDGVICPICGRNITHNEDKVYLKGISKNPGAIEELLSVNKFSIGYMYSSGCEPMEEWEFDKLFKNIKYEIIEQEKEQGKKHIEYLYNQCKISEFENTENIDKEVVLYNSSNLMKYIEAIIKLESNEQWLTERLEQLYLDEKNIERLATLEKGLKIKSIKEKVVEEEKEYKKVVEKTNQLERLSMEQAGFFIPMQPQKPREPIYETPGFLNKKRVLAENEEKRLNYDNACRIYQKDVETYEQEKIKKENEYKQFIDSERKKIDAELKEAQYKLEYITKELNDETEKISLIKLPMDELKEKIVDEIKEAEKLLSATILGKNKLYNYGIIFNKYRNIVAIATFYEYLVTGRCSTLDGTNGAYNLFESETRANIIIKELSDIKNSLEDIKENQYMIYSELKNINKSLGELKEETKEAVNRIRGGLDTISKNTEITAYYSKVNAYYSKKNAELTNALGFMVALK